MSNKRIEVDNSGAMLILVVFLLLFLFIGDPDIHDAILGWFQGRCK